MTVVNGYCTLDQVRTHLGDDAAQLPAELLERAINATSRAIENWTGRRFWQDPAPTVRRFRPTRPSGTDLPDISTTDGLLVEVETVPGTWMPWTLDTDFELGPDNADGGAYAWWQLEPIGTQRLPVTGRRTVRVTARWGWSAVPDQVQEAAILRAVALFKRKEAVYGVADFGEFGPVRITRADPDVMDLLRPFQKPMVA
ncbi:head-tail connector protein [Actinomadura harenae]|uniref:Phage gp6-like head-tail connector protein n=1 Tax=Actinomadura harenae TaxID=2483351 RepID=A0A3M2LQX4_9ACTN|nr:phage gp6-like head-tail connector protein [Actinomadura harenae]RMI39881.1 phage gp6-like head-tail connector protein [Actinomadura harenae]